MGSIVTIKDVLARPLFKDAILEAGYQGLENEIRWVHVLEVSQVKSLIRGGELILCTGVGLKGDSRIQEMFLQQLIELGAAGLCIELGSFLDRLPDRMVELADQAGFPLIAFHEIVRFVDITEDLHSLIIESKHNRSGTQKNGWIIDLVENRLTNEEQIWMHLQEQNHNVRPFTISVMELDGQHLADMQGLPALAEDSLARYGCTCLPAIHGSEMIMLILDNQDRTEREFDSGLDDALIEVSKAADISRGTGRIYHSIADAPLSYREAKEVLKYQRILPGLPASYRRIGLYRLLLHISDSRVTKTFIEDFIAPVIQYDQEHQTDLLNTLRVYLGNINSKQLAAKQLYIHRQTFYQRIEKLKELLGDDFTQKENRLNIELALKAYDLTTKSREVKHIHK